MALVAKPWFEFYVMGPKLRIVRIHFRTDIVILLTDIEEKSGGYGVGTCGDPQF